MTEGAPGPAAVATATAGPDRRDVSDQVKEHAGGQPAQCRTPPPGRDSKREQREWGDQRMGDRAAAWLDHRSARSRAPQEHPRPGLSRGCDDAQRQPGGEQVCSSVEQAFQRDRPCTRGKEEVQGDNHRGGERWSDGSRKRAPRAARGTAPSSFERQPGNAGEPGLSPGGRSRTRAPSPWGCAVGGIEARRVRRSAGLAPSAPAGRARAG
jgi:hypothetical protein